MQKLLKNTVIDNSVKTANRYTPKMQVKYNIMHYTDKLPAYNTQIIVNTRFGK